MLKKLVKSVLQYGAAFFGPHARNTREEKLWVLMYHRVLPQSDSRHEAEEPGMMVSPESLDMHFSIVKRLFKPMFLSDWLDAKNKGEKLPKKVCLITFDDGWRDNFEYALPIIEKHQMPVTLFAVAGMIGTGIEFWPNRLARVLQYVEQNLERRALLNWLGLDCVKVLEQPITFAEKSARIIQLAKQLPDHYIMSQLEKLELELDLPSPETNELMSWEQLRAFNDSPYTEIGCHTHSHIRLHQDLSDAQLQSELVQSKSDLEQKLGQEISLFCYPNGDFNQRAYDLVRRHYRAAVSTQRGINSAAHDLHKLERIGIHDDISDTPIKFRARLSGWI